MADMLTELERKIHHRQPRRYAYGSTMFYTHASALQTADSMARRLQRRVRVHRIPDPIDPAFSMWALTPLAGEPCS